MYLENKKFDMKKLPDLHKQALAFKNKKRLQHDGGRAWIKDSQLYEARSGVNGRLETIREKLDQITGQKQFSE
jgi:hypothetical protein